MVAPWPTLVTGWSAEGGYGAAMGIDREWDEPVYQQVAGILRRQIESGTIEARRPVPSIRTLCETYGIARATASKSLRVLAEEGLIRRVPGRGWFVVPEQ
jgi:DNA-binding GntR family transcriptional regulator